MAWSDAAREAALAARRMHVRKDVYVPDKIGVHIWRGEMAKWLREARSTGLRGPGKSEAAAKMATGKNHPGVDTHYYTSVKGAHFVDQGLGGLVWRQPKGVSKTVAGVERRAPRGGAPKWAASKVKYTRY
jgi:hypothetical protein